jgi:hypothetical protein
MSGLETSILLSFPFGVGARQFALSFPRPAHQRFDRHAFVDVTHADRELHRSKLNRLSARVFDFLPTD